MGFGVRMAVDPASGVEQFQDEPADLVVFDADGLGPDALNAFLEIHQRAQDKGRDLAALVLLGPRQGSLARKLPSDDRVVVLDKPIKMKEVTDAVSQLVPVG